MFLVNISKKHAINTLESIVSNHVSPCPDNVFIEYALPEYLIVQENGMVLIMRNNDTTYPININPHVLGINGNKLHSKGTVVTMTQMSLT